MIIYNIKWDTEHRHVPIKLGMKWEVVQIGNGEGKSYLVILIISLNILAIDSILQSPKHTYVLFLIKKKT